MTTRRTSARRTIAQVSAATADGGGAVEVTTRSQEARWACDMAMAMRTPASIDKNGRPPTRERLRRRRRDAKREGRQRQAPATAARQRLRHGERRRDGAMSTDRMHDFDEIATTRWSGSTGKRVMVTVYLRYELLSGRRRYLPIECTLGALIRDVALAYIDGRRQMVCSLLGGLGGAQLVAEEPSLSRRSPALQRKMGVWPWASMALAAGAWRWSSQHAPASADERGGRRREDDREVFQLTTDGGGAAGADSKDRSSDGGACAADWPAAIDRMDLATDARTTPAATRRDAGEDGSSSAATAALLAAMIATRRRDDAMAR
ncbi:hypothetical protein Scep_005941 [Stephania cephalantha]|uniref:Uncharacterized protein n=1 Tax=Stephania cephalantha TaxID=152367 RepID=A0AAP0PWW1_9MAGN